MKKVIQGKLYNTETARLVAEWDNGLGPRDFDYVAEALYCKRTGEYFVYGEGGPNTRYAQRCGSSGWMSGEGIHPVSMAEAREWMEEKASADAYEAEFGVIDEPTDHDLHVIVSDAAWAALKAKADALGVSVSKAVERLALS